LRKRGVQKQGENRKQKAVILTTTYDSRRERRQARMLTLEGRVKGGRKKEGMGGKKLGGAVVMSLPATVYFVSLSNTSHHQQ